MFKVVEPTRRLDNNTYIILSCTSVGNIVNVSSWQHSSFVVFRRFQPFCIATMRETVSLNSPHLLSHTNTHTHSHSFSHIDLYIDDNQCVCQQPVRDGLLCSFTVDTAAVVTTMTAAAPKLRRVIDGNSVSATAKRIREVRGKINNNNNMYVCSYAPNHLSV